jgi:tetratricopeptide (TPR) repeat protein
MRKRRVFLISPCLVAASLGGSLAASLIISPQQVTTSVSVYDEIFLTDTGLLALPEKAIELAFETTIKNDNFKAPVFISRGGGGDGTEYLYCSASGSPVLKFSLDGKLEAELGQKRNKPVGYNSVKKIRVSRNGAWLVAYEADKQVFEYLEANGTIKKKKKAAEVGDFAVDDNGNLYVAHFVHDKKAPLVTIYSQARQPVTFGTPLPLPHSLQELNSVSLALDNSGCLLVAFTYFPVVRCYSISGELRGEYRVETPVLQAKEVYNLKLIGEGVAYSSRRAGYRPLTLSLKTSGDKIYLLGSHPRLEITELDPDGHYTGVYWKEFRDIYQAVDFEVSQSGQEIKFWVSHSQPAHYEVDIFKKKEPGEEGLRGEIDRLTEEISLYPENYIAYINRGVDRHRLGDYAGAINDFSKAIELNPKAALAFNNRGLSKIKAGDLSGAIVDFNRAIELAPDNASFFYNRGVAYFLNKDYRRALADFEQARSLDPQLADKVREQIEFCQKQLKSSSR